ncbi:hypothetical protein B0H10DRAFT_86181 [Mycena sp. CBHHK59/15]|nr:hypothetical protein B0H10DRAFT_86181 [Mycena sp. CBHHK59/15]
MVSHFKPPQCRRRTLSFDLGAFKVLPSLHKETKPGEPDRQRSSSYPPAVQPLRSALSSRRAPSVPHVDRCPPSSVCSSTPRTESKRSQTIVCPDSLELFTAFLMITMMVSTQQSLPTSMDEAGPSTSTPTPISGITQPRTTKIAKACRRTLRRFRRRFTDSDSRPLAQNAPQVSRVQVFSDLPPAPEWDEVPMIVESESESDSETSHSNTSNHPTQKKVRFVVPPPLVREASEVDWPDEEPAWCDFM